jgi:pyruvate formate lyase activating enzyme
MLDAINVHPARYWHKLNDGRIQCDLCPRLCKPHEGQRAFCFVRASQGDEIVLPTYGRSSGFCVDPVGKKALIHFPPLCCRLGSAAATAELWVEIKIPCRERTPP